MTQNLILTKTRNSIKDVNIDRLIFIYINKRILNRPIRPRKKKLPYTHRVTTRDEDLAELEDLMLQNKDKGIKYSDSEDKEGNDEIMDNAEI